MAACFDGHQVITEQTHGSVVAAIMEFPSSSPAPSGDGRNVR